MKKAFCIISVLIVIACNTPKTVIGQYSDTKDYYLAVELYDDSTFLTTYSYLDYSCWYNFNSIGEYSIISDTLYLATCIPRLTVPTDTLKQLSYQGHLFLKYPLFFNWKDSSLIHTEVIPNQDKTIISLIFNRKKYSFEKNYDGTSSASRYTFDIYEKDNFQKVKMDPIEIFEKNCKDCNMDTVTWVFPFTISKKAYIRIGNDYIKKYYMTVKVSPYINNIVIDYNAFSTLNSTGYWDITGDKYIIKGKRLIPMKTNTGWNSDFSKTVLRKEKE